MKKSLVLVLEEKKTLTVSVLLSLIIFFVPAFVHQQFITGPIVNAVLLLSLIYLGKSRAFFLALIPSTVALSRGLLPVALAPMVPFIMMSNVLFIDIFSRFYDREKLAKSTLALFLAALLKTTFLFLIVKLLMKGLLNQALLPKVAQMMAWPQLWTALLGGTFAILVNKKYE